MGNGFCNFWVFLIESIDNSVSDSRVGKYFKLESRKTNFTTEFRAGTATFLTMAYILSVNATILADSGGTCSASDCWVSANQTTPDPDCVLKLDPGYENCLAKVKNDLLVATALISMIGCFAMGLLANLPLALAPGMGPNLYITYSLVGFHGTGIISYPTAMALVLVHGILFLVIACLGLRANLARFLPNPVRLASAGGIGIFIAFVGLQSHQGLGLIGPSSDTLLMITACSETNPVTGECLGGKLRRPTFWLGALGFVITS